MHCGHDLVACYTCSLALEIDQSPPLSLLFQLPSLKTAICGTTTRHSALACAPSACAPSACEHAHAPQLQAM